MKPGIFLYRVHVKRRVLRRHHERAPRFAVQFHARLAHAIFRVIHVLDEVHRGIGKRQYLAITGAGPDRHGQINQFHHMAPSTAITRQGEGAPRTICNGETLTRSRSDNKSLQWMSLFTVMIPDRARASSTAKSAFAFCGVYRWR